MTLGQLVLVRWADAVGPVDLDEGERLPLEVMETVGWVREVTPQYVTLAPERYADHPRRVRAATSLPIGDILYVQVLVPAQHKRPRGPHISDASWGKLQREETGE